MILIYIRITNDYGSIQDMSNGTILFVYHNGDGTFRLYLQDRGNANENYGDGLTDNTLYYARVKRTGTSASCKVYSSDSDRNSEINEVISLSITSQDVEYRYLMGGFSRDSVSSVTITGYVENLSLQEDKYTIENTLTLEDTISFAYTEEESETLTLSDEIEANVQANLQETLNIEDSIEVSTIELVRSDINNIFGMVNGVLADIDNRTGFIGRNLYDISNKIGFLKSWQVAGEAGYQSLGKTYIKVYINSVEDTDVIVDSITISKNLNASHTASFNLGKAYDNTKPSQESEVEIKYHIWTLYKGYITQITPTNNPEEIKIICQDEYWKQNKTKKYFNIGHIPSDNQELYYNYISEGLSACGASFGIGSFIPQTMNLFGTGTSDCITQLTENAGNFAWYYNVDGTKKLWTAGQGSIIELERQEIGKNLGLYQVLSHSFKESIENIVNKFRVQMGNITIRRFSNSGASKEYTSYRYERVQVGVSPAWSPLYEFLDDGTSNHYGIFFHPEQDNWKYDDIYCKYYLPALSQETEEWTDAFPPKIAVNIPFGGDWTLSVPVEQLEGFSYLKEGFTIDYEKQEVIFNEPIYLYQTNEYGEITDTRAPHIRLILYKKRYYSNTENPSDDPTSDISNPLMFFTNKMGDYPETIMENLSLTGLGIQIGGWFISEVTDEGRNIWRYIPSWNDTLFAKDNADWQLSKKCDKKIAGNIELTLDALCFYDIDLTNRIRIPGIIDTALNIISINYNIGSWRVNLTLQNGRYYKRSVSIPSHGE